MQTGSGEPRPRRQVTIDVSRGWFVTEGLLIVLVGLPVSWLALHGVWQFVGASVSTALGLALAMFGRTSEFWLEEEDVVCWGSRRHAVRISLTDAEEITTVFVPKGPRNLRINGREESIEIPINDHTEPLRLEIGLVFRAAWPTRMLSDRSAMDALLLQRSE